MNKPIYENQDEGRVFYPGDIVTHYKYDSLDKKDKKRNKCVYQIIGVGIDCVTESKVVIYQAMYEDFQLFVRPYDEFFGFVNIEEEKKGSVIVSQKYHFDHFKEKDNKKK